MGEGGCARCPPPLDSFSLNERAVMAIEKYGQTHGGPNVQLAHTTAGTQVSQVSRVNGTGEGVQQAALYSTAPYKGDRKKGSGKESKTGKPGLLCTANNDTCKGFRAKGSLYCVGHLRSFGMLKNDKNRAAHPKDAPA